MTSSLADRLTAQEIRVALAVAHGSTNKAVARELGVSVKTIEFHLASVYRKAGVASRGELAHLLRSLAVEPPTGTVSFLCVELSAADVDGLPPARRAVGVLGECRARFARIVADAGGYACHLGADGFGAAFPSPVQAAAAAVACQCDAASLGVRPRLAIHTGVATLLGSAYVGAPVHRVAQLAAMANSGQVLVSAAAAGLLLDEDWTLVDMGWQRVDGEGREERVARLQSAAMPDVALPTRPAADDAGTLPADRGPIVGRTADVERVAAAISRHRLVTVTGTGGVGKTTLAVAVAREAGRRYRQGAWFVELGHVRRDRDVAPVTATALGLKLRGAGSSATVAAALRDQERLVVVDNCEHVLAGAAELVAAIVSSCPGVSVLATSRERLGVEGQQIIVLAPLDVGATDAAAWSDAAGLFVERVRGALGEFDPDRAELDVVEEICRHLDGLPLAIELAAARLSNMTLDELRLAVHDRFRALRGHRGGQGRHESLRTVIAWSYDTLTDDAQRAMDGLSVFAGSFDAEAAAAVAGDSALDELVDKSLLGVEHRLGAVRYEQLETIREFGADRLRAHGLTDELRRRHAAHYRDWAERADHGIRRGDELAWHRAIQADWHNLRTAVNSACAADDADTGCALIRSVFWWAMSRAQPEFGEWADAVRSLPSCADHPMRPIVTAAATYFAFVKGESDRSRELYFEAVAEEERLGEATEPWVDVVGAFFIFPSTEDPAASSRRVQRRAGDDSFWRVLGTQQVCATVAPMVAFAGLPEAEADALVAFLGEARTMADEFGNVNGIAYAAMTLGQALRYRDPSYAVNLLEEAIELAAPLDLEITVAQSRRDLATMYVELGRPLDALRLVRPAIRQHVRSGATAELRIAILAGLLALVALDRADVAATAFGALGPAGYSGMEQAMFEIVASQLGTRLDEDEIARLRAVGAQTGMLTVLDELVALIDSLVD